MGLIAPVVVCLPFLLYSFVLTFPFMCDDFCLVAKLSGDAYGESGSVLNLYDFIRPELVREYPQVAPWWTSPTMKLRFLRPLASLSLGLDHLIWGKNPFGYHLTNLLIHCASCLVVFFLGRVLFKETLAALLAAMIFAFHPCVVFGVQWVADRNGLLSLFFGALGVLLHARFRREKAKRWEVLAWLCFVAAFLSKESGAVVIAAYAAYDIFVWRTDQPGEWPGVLRMGLYYTLLCLPLALFVVYFSSAGYGIVGRYTILNEGWSPGRLLAYVAKSAFLYLISLLFVFVPVNDRVNTLLLEQPLVLFSSLAMVVLSAVFLYPAWRARLFRDGRYPFLVVWLLALVVPLLSIRPANRYLYPAAAPFGLFMGSYLSWIKRARGFGGLTGIGFFALVVYFTAAPIAVSNIASPRLKNVYSTQSRIAQQTLRYIDARKPPTDVFFVNLPYSWLYFGLQYAFDFQAGKGAVRTFPLTVSEEVPEVTVLGDRALRIEAVGRPFLDSEFDRMFLTEPLDKEGTTVSRPFLKATIEKVEDGHIRGILFEFASAFDDPRAAFFFIEKDTVYPVFSAHGAGELSPEAVAEGRFSIFEKGGRGPVEELQRIGPPL